MNDWALILGGSSGIGMACAKSLTENGINIYALYLKKKQSQIDEIKKQFSNYNVEVIFKKANASNEDSIEEITNELKSLAILGVKMLIHSVAFGALKKMISKMVIH